MLKETFRYLVFYIIFSSCCLFLVLSEINAGTRIGQVLFFKLKAINLHSTSTCLDIKINQNFTIFNIF